MISHFLRSLPKLVDVGIRSDFKTDAEPVVNSGLHAGEKKIKAKPFQALPYIIFSSFSLLL
jgi:hypothetical protein